jgi:hypothetical protein
MDSVEFSFLIWKEKRKDHVRWKSKKIQLKQTKGSGKNILIVFPLKMSSRKGWNWAVLGSAGCYPERPTEAPLQQTRHLVTRVRRSERTRLPSGCQKSLLYQLGFPAGGFWLSCPKKALPLSSSPVAPFTIPYWLRTG